MKKFQSIRGMSDIVEKQAVKWLKFEEIIRYWANLYSYDHIRTPILEDTELFIRNIGENTDIVEKEMYSFVDSLNNEKLTLRPEGTVATLRACLENNLLHNKTQRLWYMGPMFRHERPQKGRYRQFHQVGFECIGFNNPEIDAEMCQMVQYLWQKLDIQNVHLEVNTLGNPKERSVYWQHLIQYFERYKADLDEQSLNRLYKNPLRILDSKVEKTQQICENAPKLKDFLQAESLQHYQRWLELLNALNVSFVENDKLVRGLDYYNHSVFEWVHQADDKALTICAGGRYNGLLKELGGEDMPSIGFALGVERVLDLCTDLGEIGTDIYVANAGEKAAEQSLLLTQFLRRQQYSVRQDFSQNKFKSQIKQAVNLGCQFIIFIGEEEIAQAQLSIKNLHNGKSAVINSEDFYADPAAILNALINA